MVAARDDLYRLGLATLLREQGVNVVAQAGSTEAAAERAAALDLDAVVLELRRPGTATLAVARLREGADRPSVIALSASPSSEEAIEALSAGAAGYLDRATDPARIAAVIRSLRNGETFMPKGVADALLAPLRESRSPVDARQVPDVALSERELEVLALVARGLANGGIARELVVTASTVKNHLTRIVTKLGAQNRTHAAVLAVRRGYI